MSRRKGLVVLPYENAYEVLWNSLDSTLVKTPVSSFTIGEHRLTDQQFDALSSPGSFIEVDIETNEIQKIVEPLGLSLGDLRLSVRTYSKFMNLSDIVFSEPLTEVTGRPFSIQLSGHTKEDQDPLFAWSTGFKVQVVLTLDVDRQLPEKSLAPRFRHTVLADASFSFASPNSVGTGLEIRRMNDDIRRAERIPKNTAIYLKRIESPITTNKLTDVLSVYVDSRLLDQLLVRKNTNVAKLHIAQIGVNILNDVVLRSSLELNQQLVESGEIPNLESLRKTVLGKLIEMLEKKGQSLGHKLSAEQILDELLERPELTFARIQAIYGYQSKAIESLELEEN